MCSSPSGYRMTMNLFPYKSKDHLSTKMAFTQKLSRVNGSDFYWQTTFAVLDGKIRGAGEIA